VNSRFRLEFAQFLIIRQTLSISQAEADDGLMIFEEAVTLAEKVMLA
jgi:hypothetical protein